MANIVHERYMRMARKVVRRTKPSLRAGQIQAVVGMDRLMAETVVENVVTMVVGVDDATVTMVELVRTTRTNPGTSNQGDNPPGMIDKCIQCHEARHK